MILDDIVEKRKINIAKQIGRGEGRGRGGGGGLSVK